MTKRNKPRRVRSHYRRGFVLLVAALCGILIPGLSFAQLPDPDATPTPAIDTSRKTPSQWVAQLGAQDPARRAEATAALVILGGKARDTVQAALDSKDAAIQSGAQEVWKTVRWDVVPGAEEDIARFLNPPAESWQVHNIWVYFKQKHGMQTLRLIAEFQDGKMEKTCYHEALLVLLGFSPPEEVAAFIKAASPDLKKRYMALLALLPPGGNGPMLAGNVARIYDALGENQKAYDYALAAATVNPWMNDDYRKLVAAGAAAVKQGGLINSVKQSAPAAIKSETDPGRLCAKLAFYCALLDQLGQKEAIAPLCDSAAGRTAAADDRRLRCLVESLLAAGMPDRALKALDGAKGLQALYMHSSLALKAGDKAVSGADWDAAMQIIDAGKRPEDKKSCWLDLGELMHDWHDARAGDFFQKILATTPNNTAYDIYACYQLGCLMEEQHQPAGALGYYEKGLSISDAIGNQYEDATPDGHGIRMFFLEEDAVPIKEKVAKLKAQAAPAPSPSAGNP